MEPFLILLRLELWQHHQKGVTDRLPTVISSAPIPAHHYTQNNYSTSGGPKGRG